MKHIKLLFGISMLLIQSIQAQDSALIKKIVYKVRLHEINSIKSSGYLYAMDDSTMFLSPSLFDKSFMNLSGAALQKFDYSHLEKVRLQRNNSAGRGALFGSVSGLVVGAIAGFAMGDDPPNTAFFRTSAGEKAIILGLTGAAFGAITGVIIGALSHRTFHIGGNKKKYLDMKSAIGGRIIQR